MAKTVPDPDPDIPWRPLAPGELVRTITASDPAYARSVRESERAAMPKLDTNEAVEDRARALLADNLDALSDIIRDSNSTPQQVTAAMRALANIAGVGGETLNVNVAVGGLAARLIAGRRQARAAVTLDAQATDAES